MEVGNDPGPNQVTYKAEHDMIPERIESEDWDTSILFYKAHRFCSSFFGMESIADGFSLVFAQDL